MAQNPNSEPGFFARLRSRFSGDTDADPEPDTTVTNPGLTQVPGDDPGGGLVDTGDTVQEDPVDDVATVGSPPAEWSPSADAGGATATATGLDPDLADRLDLQSGPAPGPDIGSTDANFFATSFEQAPLGNALPDPTVPEPEAPLEVYDPPIDVGPEPPEGELPL
jgi:hypothetical protein